LYTLQVLKLAAQVVMLFGSWIMYLELNQNMTLNEIIPTFIVTRWSRTDVWDLYEQADSRFMVFLFFFLWQTHFISCTHHIRWIHVLISSNILIVAKFL
jgi:hypothetical protein